MHDFYIIDAKIEGNRPGAGPADIGLDKDVTDLAAASVPRCCWASSCWRKAGHSAAGRGPPTTWMSSIEWLKRYLNEYENAFILIPTTSRS